MNHPITAAFAPRHDMVEVARELNADLAGHEVGGRELGRESIFDILCRTPGSKVIAGLLNDGLYEADERQIESLEKSIMTQYQYMFNGLA